MASQPEKAYTCTIPSRKDTSFLRFAHSEWSKIDIIGQTIILAELTAHFGSFQNTCTALKLRSNEVESFLLTHLQYQQVYEQGNLIAAQWGRDQAIPANEGDDIPQQRPILVCASSITPACDFLGTIGYDYHIPAVRAWIRRTITWPPDIDVAGLDTSTLDQSDVNFPTPRKQREYSRYTSFLGNDDRAVVALVGAWRPREDGTPDTRVAFIDVPNGTVVYGPRGARHLVGAGRYYVCWPTDSLSDSQYNDLVLARNALDGRGGGNTGPNPTNSNDFDDINIDIEAMLSGLGRAGEGVLEAMNEDEIPSMADPTLRTDWAINPKGIFGTGMPDAHGLVHTTGGPFHPQDEAQGPSRKLANPQLQQTWSSWPGELFQFRLPSGHTILDPMGNLLTFDPPQHERYDDLGNPQGIGGTYFIVPPWEAPDPISFKLDDLPADVALRFKVRERLVIVRNGLVLPRFVEPGVHEWSTREGFLDLYSANGCYDVLQTEGRYSILPDAVGNVVGQGAHQVPEQHDEHSHGLAYDRATMGLSPIAEASEILAPYRGWLNHQEAEAEKLEQGVARVEARRARDQAYRDVIMQERKSRKRALEIQEVQERATFGAIVPGNTAIAQDTQTRGGRKKYSLDALFDAKRNGLLSFSPRSGDARRKQSIDSSPSMNPDVPIPNTTTPKASRRKRIDSDEEEYVPTRSRPSRAKKPKSTPTKTPTPRKSNGKRAGDVLDADESPSPSVLKSRRNRARLAQHLQTEMRGLGLGSAPPHAQQPSGALAGPSPPRPPPGGRKPIGPLLDAIWAGRDLEEGGAAAILQLSTVPK